ncbi:hypothetical protein [Motilibacter peucedani]|uniref:hypothetical protein n=1 Tax=Motilibacter peucedani TaxID=598650 RepID=UPI0011C47813|nr:hypothetical protein [Motilibacter peucedani]
MVEIAARLGLAAPPMSSGSTEPKLIFTMVNERLGLGLSARLAKPEMARAIVEAAGDHWHPDFESRGATVTKNGLLAVLDAVAFFLA